MAKRPLYLNPLFLGGVAVSVVGILAMRRSSTGLVSRGLPGGGEPVVSKSLSSLHPVFRGKVEQLMARMEARGFRPHVATAWRNLAWQRQAKADGRSQLDFGLHNVTDMQSGAPAALAVDLVGRPYAWGEPPHSRAEAASFFKALGEEAKKLGLAWGGDYTQKNVWKNYGMGWDPAHVSWQRESGPLLAQLKRGEWPAGLGPVPG
jgi:hypothetical protein